MGRVGGDFIPWEIWLERVAVVQGRLIAIDGRRHVRAADNGQVPADVAIFYKKVNERLRAGDCQIVLSHIERSADNLQRVLRGVRQSRLPVSYVFVTERRSGIGGKAEVAKLSRAKLVCLTIL